MQTEGTLKSRTKSTAQVDTVPTEHDSFTIATNEVLSLLGIRGFGKTFLLKNALLPQVQRAVFYDHVYGYPDDYVEIKDLKKYPNWYITERPRELVDLMYKALEKGNLKKNYYIAYRPKQFNLIDFELFCRLCYGIGNFTFIVDEMADVCTPARITDWHSQILRVGRHRNMGYIGITQRPASVHNLYKSQVTRAFAFRLNLPADIMYLKKWMGTEMAELKTLPYFHFLYWDGTEIFKMKPLRPKEEIVQLVEDEKTSMRKTTTDKDEEKDAVLQVVDETEEFYE